MIDVVASGSKLEFFPDGPRIVNFQGKMIGGFQICRRLMRANAKSGILFV